VLTEWPGRGAVSHVIRVIWLRCIEHGREMFEYAASEERGAVSGERVDMLSDGRCSTGSERMADACWCEHWREEMEDIRWYMLMMLQFVIEERGLRVLGEERAAAPADRPQGTASWLASSWWAMLMLLLLLLEMILKLTFAAS